MFGRISFRLAMVTACASFGLSPCAGWAQTPEKTDKAAPAKTKPSVASPKAAEKTKKLPVFRQDFIDRPGAVRTPIRLRGGEQLPAKAYDQNKFDRMRRGNEPISAQLIDMAAQNHVAQLTDRANENELASFVKRISENITSAKTAGKWNVDFVKAYKRSVVKHLREIFKGEPMRFSLVTQVNAVLVLHELTNNNPEIDIEDPIDLLAEIIGIPGREDAVIYVAIEGLLRASESLTKVATISAAATNMMAVVNRGDVQDVLLEQIIRAFGVLKRPNSGGVVDRAEIAVFLANTAMRDHDPKTLDRAKLEAGLAFAKMDVSGLPDWNADLSLFVICHNAKYTYDVYVANLIPEERYRFHMVQLVQAATNMGKTLQLDPFKANIASTVRPLGEAAISKQSPDTSGLEKWLQDHPKPARLNITKRADPVTVNLVTPRLAAKRERETIAAAERKEAEERVKAENDAREKAAAEAAKKAGN